MSKALSILDSVLEAFVSVCLTAAAMISFAEVVLRYVFQSSLTWSFEVLAILLTYMSFVGAVLALRRRGHLRILVLVDLLPRGWRIGGYFISLISVGVTAAVMAIWGSMFVSKFADDVTDILQIRMFWLYIVIPVSGVLMMIQVTIDVVAGALRAYRGEAIELDDNVGISDI